MEALRNGSHAPLHESFKLICDDLSLSNVLVDDEGKIVSVTD